MTEAAILESPRAPAEPPRRRFTQAGAARREMWFLLLPALIPVALFSVWPLLQGIYLGFTDARAGRNVVISFIGVDNFQRLLHYKLFWDSFKIGLIWALSVTVIQFFLALGLALLLNMNLRFRGFGRVLALVPWAMPPVIVAIMWRLIFDPRSGPVNGILQFFGLIDTDINWLGTFGTALPAVIVVGVWRGMPQTTITLLAGLQSVDGALHEAAQVDGAGPWQRFRHITLPALRPVIAAITSLDFIWNFNSFDLVFVLTAGGPGGKTMLPMLFAYNEAFKYGHFGLASAMGDVMVILVVVLLLVYLRSQLRSNR
jgi:multiple sugar transport system permease protein